MTFHSSLADFLKDRYIEALRAALADGGAIDDAIAERLSKDVFRSPEVRLRVKRASPHEQVTAADEINVFLRELHELGYEPPSLLVPQRPDKMNVEPPAVKAMLTEAAATMVSKADEALAQSAGDADPPSQSYLAEWMGAGQVPPETLAEVERRLAVLWGLEPQQVRVTGWAFGGLVAWRDGVETHVPAADLVAEGSKIPHGNPLAPLVKACPVPVEPNTRPDRILPARLAMIQPSDRRAGRLFTPAAHFAPDGQQVLPGFEQAITGPALPLALYDLGAGPGVSRGKGAPVALRLFVTSVLHVPMEQRDQTVVFELSLRDLQEQIWPGRVLSRARSLRAIVQGGEVLDSMAARMPWHGGLYRVVDILAVPSSPDADHPVKVRVQLPPGSGQGPLVTPTLADWGVRDAAAYRGLLNLAYRWHDPGVTRHPVGKGRRHWIQSQDPERYPELFDDDLVEIFYPTTARKGRRFVVRDARAALQRLADAGELRIEGRRVLPPGPSQE